MQGPRFFRASAIVLFLCGCAHTMGHLTSEPKNAAEVDLLARMEAATNTMAGMTFSIRDVLDCLSWTMSILTFSMAWLMLALRTHLATSPPALARASWIVATSCAALVFVALENGLLPPALFYGLAGGLAALAALRA